LDSLISDTGACLVTLAFALLELSRSVATCATCWTLTGDAACCFGVLLVICCNSSYNLRSFPCLNFRSLSWMVAFTALFCFLFSDDLCIWSCRMGHGSKSALLSQVGCIGGLRASFVDSMTARNVPVTPCSSLYQMLVVSGCRKVGGCGFSSVRKVRPAKSLKMKLKCCSNNCKLLSM
jgi:hypothetical protein